MIKTILPKSTIGIIGGGQLGRMLAMSAKEMGYKVAILDPGEDACARKFADYFIHSAFNVYENIEKLCKLSDVVTFEFENIDIDSYKKLENEYNFVQASRLLEISQHRLKEKEYAESLGIPTVKYFDSNKDDYQIDGKYVMKTTRFGYDGKGQSIISSNEEVEKDTILEELIDLDKEISVVAVKDIEGIEIVAVVENEHRENILYRSNIPANITKEQEEKAIDYTKRILDDNDYYGVLTVEYFISDGEVIFNEIAPRVHNSGHITQESATKSQFRAHIEAICGLKVGKIENREATLYNILGQNEEYFINLITKKQGYLHLYEKEARHNRKIGHMNFLGSVYLEDDFE